MARDRGVPKISGVPVRRVTEREMTARRDLAQGKTGTYTRQNAFQRLGSAASSDRVNRTVPSLRRTGAYDPSSYAQGGGGGGVMIGTSRPRNPQFWYRQNNVPIEIQNEEQLRQVREFCRLLYFSHPVVGACTDIYAQFPLQGLRFRCKDPRVEEFHSELFLEQLNYLDHLEVLNRQYWLSGEIFSLGEWDENLGIWSADTHINPDDVEMQQASLFSQGPSFLMRLPESLRRILNGEAPQYQRIALLDRYPELAAYTDSDARIPVSDVIMKQLMFTGDDYNPRGIPLLLRGMRTLIQEEMLNSALDSIADRLYSPLILSKLGASAKDLGTDVPWVPTGEQLDEFNVMLDMALAADFRMLTYHWAIDIQPVFGRENVPDLGNDFDRITERTLMVYGMSQTMLTGASAGETYAADALNRDVITQRLSNNQRMLRRFTRDRMAIVAEAQEHYDYEVTRGRRYLKTQEIAEQQEDGSYRMREVPKLLIPDVEFDTLNLSDAEQERQFIEQLAATGVPVPYRRRIQGVGLDFGEMIEERQAEEVQLVVAEAETELRSFQALRARNLPIPQDLMDKFKPKAIMPGAQVPMTGSGPGQPLPSLGQLPTSLPVLAPTQDELNQAADVGAGTPALPQSADANDNGQDDETEYADVPPESSDQRGRMPKAAARRQIDDDLEQMDHYVKQALARIEAERLAQAEAARATPERHREAVEEAPEAIEHLGFRKWALEGYQPPEVEPIDSWLPEDHPPMGLFGAPKTAGQLENFPVNEKLTIKWARDHPDELGTDTADQ